MTKRKRKPIQTISIVLSVLFFAGTGLMQLVNSLQPASPSTENPSVSLISRVNITHELSAGLAQTYSFVRGDTVAFTYQGDIGDVVTLRITPDTDILPRVLLYIGDSETHAAIFDTPEICGLEIMSEDVYQFVFGATASDYVVEFDTGNTCESG